jgi:calcineurin-like phosphoesterase family protein
MKADKIAADNGDAFLALARFHERVMKLAEEKSRATSNDEILSTFDDLSDDDLGLIHLGIHAAEDFCMNVVSPILRDLAGRRGFMFECEYHDEDEEEGEESAPVLH